MELQGQRLRGQAEAESSDRQKIRAEHIAKLDLKKSP